MKNIPFIWILLIGILMVSCGTSQKFQASVSEDKPLFAAINELHKHPENRKAQEDIKIFYGQAITRHEEAIDVYRTSNDPKRWDKILKELNALQHIYSSISSTTGSASLIKPTNYIKEIEQVRELAAEDYYRQGTELISYNGRENSRNAYEAFKKVNQYVAGYKDVESLLKESYEKSVINIVINPIEENNIFFSSYSSRMTDFRYRPEDYQQALVRDLGGRNVNAAAARFYTEREAQRDKINPDWVVDIQWRNIDPLRSFPNQYNRQVSKNVQVGSDTAGKPIYRTVHATVHITQRTYTVRGDLDYSIYDRDNDNYVDQGTIMDDVSWAESFATYSGDSRALDQQDWQMINNRNFNRNPSQGDILNTLMRKMYPDLRRRIENSVY